jgi:KDO2-lipid IV(A) lauroyltransferase
VTGHFGAWELGARFWPAQGFRTAVVARRIKNPLVDAWVTGIRSSGGVRVIPAREAVRESVRWLKQGNLLGILIDHRVTEGGLKIDFFGRPAFTTALPAILALRYGVPVHPVHSWREKDKVKVHIAPAMDFSDLKSRDESITEAVSRMNKVVESWVRERPEAWLWIHNRWKTT